MMEHLTWLQIWLAISWAVGVLTSWFRYGYWDDWRDNFYVNLITIITVSAMQIATILALVSVGAWRNLGP
jgi:hypothetical protein